MLATFDAMLLKVTDPNEKGYVDVTVLPEGSDYPERLWCKASEPGGKAALQLSARQHERPNVTVCGDLRASITKGDSPRAYLNGRVESVVERVQQAVKPGPRAVAQPA
jgi:hypothetical protein